MSLSAQTFLFVLFFSLVAAWFIVRALWRNWATSRVRRAARAATPAVDALEATVAAFHKRFPVPVAVRLRGIPVAAVKGGLGGTVAGTQPEAELLRKERARTRA